MSNKYPVQVRMREMSKQEEILLKRKREIERKMKEQQHGNVKAAKTNPPLPKLSAQNVSESPNPSVAAVPQVPNRFNNDGSFLEQFKKLAEKQTEVKEEKDSSTEKLKSSRPVTAKLKTFNQVPPPKQMIAAQSLFLGQDFTSSTSPDLKDVKIECDTDDESSCSSQPFKEEVEQPDWFKEALKKAQARAKELCATAPAVSLSAGSSEDDSSMSQDSVEQQAKRRKSRWGNTSTVQPVPVQLPPQDTPSNGMELNQQGSEAK